MVLRPFVAAARLPILILAGVLFLPAPASSAQKPQARNVILFLADGTGLATLNAASIRAHGKPQALFVQQMPHIGLSDSSPASNWVTDSAAGMTAIVTGVKTHNGVISQGPDARRGVQDGAPLKSILEYAEQRGLSTGVVTNSPLADATPAACFAHANDRGKWGEIFAQILTPRFGDGVEVAIGGGRDKILEQSAALGLDMPAKLKAAGYWYFEDPAALSQPAPAGVRRMVGLLPVAEEKIPLAAAVDRAVSLLSRNPKGFFLMVESNNHYNDIGQSVDLMARFDSIIQKTAERLKGTGTLILFTADHSFDLRLPSSKPKRGEDIVPYMKVDGSHTAEEVLVAAQGPGAEAVHGYMPNTRIFRIMMDAFGWK